MQKAQNKLATQNLKDLQNILNYKFKNIVILQHALTHSSCGSVGLVVPNNERLEFLGDRVLNLCIASLLFKMFPNENEGTLAKRHTALVRKETLAVVANAINLGEQISLSKGEENSGGRKKETILSDSMEAVLAALYIDGGLEVAENFITNNWQSQISKNPIKDPKSHLQEWLQAKGEPLPKYILKQQEGKAHNATFVIEASTEKYGSAEGSGSSKQQASQQAAIALLLKIGEK